MIAEDITQFCKDYAAEEFDIGWEDEDDSFQGNGLGRLEIQELIDRINNKYDIEISEEEGRGIDCIDELIDAVLHKKNLK